MSPEIKTKLNEIKYIHRSINDRTNNNSYNN